MSEATQTSSPEPAPAATPQRDWLVVPLHLLQPGARALLEVMEARLRKFAVDQDSRAEPDELVRAWLEAFWRGQPNLFAIAIMVDQVIVGHMLCQIEAFYSSTRRYLTVLQYELDESPPTWLRKLGWRALQGIARNIGCEAVYALCPNEKVAKAHAMFRGFERYSTVMVAKLEGGG